MPPTEPFRVSMKAWCHPDTGKMHLIALGRLDPVTHMVKTYAMSDDDTIELTLTVDAWNALPYRYFKDDGPADPRKTHTIDPILDRNKYHSH